MKSNTLSQHSCAMELLRDQKSMKNGFKHALRKFHNSNLLKSSPNSWPQLT